MTPFTFYSSLNIFFSDVEFHQIFRSQAFWSSMNVLFQGTGTPVPQGPGTESLQFCFLMLYRLITSLLSSIPSEFETDLIKIEYLSGLATE